LQAIVAIPNAENAPIAESEASLNESREGSTPCYNKVTRGRIILF